MIRKWCSLVCTLVTCLWQSCVHKGEAEDCFGLLVQIYMIKTCLKCSRQLVSPGLFMCFDP